MAVGGVNIVRAGAERIADLERLWVALQRHHAGLVEALPELTARSLQESWDRRRAAYEAWLAEPDAFVLIAELGGVPVGYALVRIVDGFHSFGPDERLASVETLSVLPEARGRRVGSALMDAVERELAEVGVGRLKLAVVEGNEEASRFYAGRGLSTVSRVLVGHVSASPPGPREHAASGDLHQLPPGLPVPEDDGAADHLPGTSVPDVRLTATRGEPVDLAGAARGTLVLYVFPRTGGPGIALPDDWDEIPGARGCTPENCAFRDHARELAAAGARVYGLSAQPLDEQRAFAEREAMPYPLLNDQGLVLADRLGLPTFEAGGLRLYRRLTLIARHGRIERIFYPVRSPARHPGEVLEWLQRRVGQIVPAGGGSRDPRRDERHRPAT